MKEQEINFGQNPEQFKTLVGNHEICNVMGDGLYLKIREGIAELQGLELEEVTDEAVFTEPREKGGLGADSLARVEIVMKIEDILMEEHLGSCLVHQIKKGQTEKATKEILKVYQLKRK